MMLNQHKQILVKDLCVYQVNKWKKCGIPKIHDLKIKFNKAKIIIIGSYYPKKKENIKLARSSLNSDQMLHENIESWNNDISKYVKDKKNITFLPLDNIISENDLEKDGITIKPKSIKKLSKDFIS